MEIYKDFKYILLNCPPDYLYVHPHQQVRHHFYWLCSISLQGGAILMSDFRFSTNFYLNLSSKTNSDSCYQG